MSQGPPHKTRYGESNRGESGNKKKTLNTWAQGKFPEENTTRIDKCDLIKLQNFCKAKDTVSWTKWQPIDWEKIFTTPTSDRGLISNIYKDLKKLDSREPNNPIKNWVQS